MTILWNIKPKLCWLAFGKHTNISFWQWTASSRNYNSISLISVMVWTASARCYNPISLISLMVRLRSDFFLFPITFPLTMQEGVYALPMKSSTFSVLPLKYTAGHSQWGGGEYTTRASLWFGKISTVFADLLEIQSFFFFFNRSETQGTTKEILRGVNGCVFLAWGWGKSSVILA